MRVFNAFQITAMFAASPFLIAYLEDATFKGAIPAFYAACIAYTVGFIAMCGATYGGLRD